MMKSTSTVLSASKILTGSQGQKAWPTTPPVAGESIRISGDQEPPTKHGDLWKSGRLSTEAPLPVGYNAPTPENAIEMKTYPTVRRAQVESNDYFMKQIFGQSRGFWSLFSHIKNRQIAMTAPVEFDLRDA